MPKKANTVLLRKSEDCCTKLKFHNCMKLKMYHQIPFKFIDKCSVFQSIQLTVMAKDQGQTQRSASATVLVNLVDDSTSLPPVWTNTDCAISVPEDKQIGQSLYNFSATSSLSGQPTLSFGLVDDYNIFNTFSVALPIQLQQGSLRLRSNLDYEKAIKYTLRLKATVSYCFI